MTVKNKIKLRMVNFYLYILNRSNKGLSYLKNQTYKKIEKYIWERHELDPEEHQKAIEKWANTLKEDNYGEVTDNK